jgi:hypothetical protein
MDGVLILLPRLPKSPSQPYPISEIQSLSLSVESISNLDSRADEY